MNVAQGVFILLSAVTLGAALGVVTNRNLFHSALLMILAFVGVAGLYLLLEAGFLAAVQVLIYVGAIAILIIFAVMLTRGLMLGKERQINEQWAFAAIAALLLFGLLAVVLLRVGWPVTQALPPADTIARLGQALMGPYVLPFEVASVLLLVALVGAIIIARESE